MIRDDDLKRNRTYLVKITDSGHDLYGMEVKVTWRGITFCSKDKKHILLLDQVEVVREWDSRQDEGRKEAMLWE